MAKATDKVKVTAKDGGETSPTRTKVGGEAMARKTKATQTNDKRQDGEKSKEKGKNKGKQPVCQYCEKQGHISRDCFKRMADENTTTTTTNSSQQLTIEDDIDSAFTAI